MSFRRIQISTNRVFDEFKFRRIEFSTNSSFDDLSFRRIQISTNWVFVEFVIRLLEYSSNCVSKFKVSSYPTHTDRNNIKCLPKSFMPDSLRLTCWHWRFIWRSFTLFLRNPKRHLRNNFFNKSALILAFSECIGNEENRCFPISGTIWVIRVCCANINRHILAGFTKIAQLLDDFKNDCVTGTNSTPQ